MIADDKGAVINCGFCNETYSITENELRAMIA